VVGFCALLQVLDMEKNTQLDTFSSSAVASLQNLRVLLLTLNGKLTVGGWAGGSLYMPRP